MIYNSVGISTLTRWKRRALSSPRSKTGRVSLFAAATLVAAFVPMLTFAVTTADGPSLVGSWSHYPTTSTAAGHVTSPMGCVKALTAPRLNARFRARMGPLVGMDGQHVIRIGRGRYLWLFSDAYLDYTHRARTLLETQRVGNVAALQRRRCFTLVRGGTAARAGAFEPGYATIPRDHSFWPLGGEAHGGRVFVFWAEMQRDEIPPPGDGIYRHPVRTWLATYDATTLKRLRLRPAPNDGVFPQFGFAVASNATHTYLFGNSNLLNLTYEGGFYNGPHSATRMYLARVPIGRLGRPPVYRTARGWSADARDAVPFSSRFWTENTMQPRFVRGRWVAVTKKDGFWGTRTIVETAARPWGPWRVVSRRTIKPFRGYDEMNNYQPIILPYRGPSGNLIIAMSQNARNWSDAVEDFSMYRPQIYAEPWPGAQELGLLDQHRGLSLRGRHSVVWNWPVSADPERQNGARTMR